MKIVFLGTNGWYSTSLANTSCILIDTEEYYVVLDAGDGIYKIEEYIGTEKPIFIFLSHLHLDHIMGFHVFGKFKFNQNVEIHGYEGTRNGLEIVSRPYTTPLSELPLKIEIHDLKEGKHSKPFPFTCKLLVHSGYSLGYRFELENKVVTYCTDTGICKNLNELSESADLLITECSFKAKPTKGKLNTHLKPQDAANIALKANAKKLALTHFGANFYRNIGERKYAQNVARKIFKNTFAAFDGLEIKV
jgi:ribonuclease BN (tRNA processing enzyme)